MLLQFSVGNFLSFKTKTMLSLADPSIVKYGAPNRFPTERHGLLKGTMLFGANLSGKSNFTPAMSAIRHLVLQSSGQSSTDKSDANLHLLLTLAVTRLFNPEQFNANNARLTFPHMIRIYYTMPMRPDLFPGILAGKQ